MKESKWMKKMKQDVAKEVRKKKVRNDSFKKKKKK